MSKTVMVTVFPPSTRLEIGAHLLWQGRKILHCVSSGPRLCLPWQGARELLQVKPQSLFETAWLL